MCYRPLPVAGKCGRDTALRHELRDTPHSASPTVDAGVRALQGGATQLHSALTHVRQAAGVEAEVEATNSRAARAKGDLAAAERSADRAVQLATTAGGAPGYRMRLALDETLWTAMAGERWDVALHACRSSIACYHAAYAVRPPTLCPMDPH
jgi:hypothetical protein